MNHQELQELLIFAALDTLEPDEARLLDAHVASCATCPVELASLRQTVGWMGAAVAPVTPPPELRARVLASVAVRPAIPGARPATGLWRAMVAAAGLAIAAMVAALVMYAAGLSARVQAIEGELAAERDLATFLASPDTATIVLAGTEQSPKARLKLVYDRRSGRAILFGYDLPPAPEGKAYQLWFIAGGKPLPGRVFSPDTTGRGSWKEEVPPEGREASVFAITVEPAGGMTAPTGPMVLKSVAVS
jgi:anti-sigma-K factor RskA